jgi:enterochelin esterase-like enzyme
MQAMAKPLFVLTVLLAATLSLGGGKTLSAGRIESHAFHSRVFGNERYIRVWLPPGYDTGKGADYPVLYLNDGQFIYHATATTKNMRGDWHADETVARLIAKGKIEPLIIVAIDNGGREGRSREYLPIVDTTYRPAMKDAVGDRFPEMLFNEIVPFINSRYRTRKGPKGFVIGGSSFGAVAALFCAMARPGAVGGLLLESPSLYVGEGWLFKQAEGVSKWPEKVYLGVGTNEVPGNEEYSKEAVDDVLRFEKQLKKSGMAKRNIKVVIENGGTHVEDAWARRLSGALQFLFAKSD